MAATAPAELRQRKVVDLTSAPSTEQLDTFTPPSLTIKDLLSAIPAHCFERSAAKSFAYLFMDFAFIGTFAFLASHLNTLFGSHGSIAGGPIGQAVALAGWAAYWWFTGLVMTGVWVIAHECGHQAFSTSKTLNNAVGWVLHSALLVPYHSWRISHARHHAATGHMTRDEVFVPRTATEAGYQSEQAKSADSLLAKADDILEDAPLWAFINILGQQLLGWPLYICMNAAGQTHYPKGTNHFNPEAIIFDKRHFSQVIMSDVGLALTFAALYFWAQATSYSTVIAYYGIPYLFVNHWLVLITYLQHTDPHLPHYRAAEWNFQRGAICTQDRNVWNFFTHSIANTHVAHHVKSSIPHYHAHDATAALKTVLGEHYRFSNEKWMTSLWKVHNSCKYVDDEGDVVFFRNAHGEAQRKVVYDGQDSGVDLQ